MFGGFEFEKSLNKKQSLFPLISQAEPVEETYCSDEIEVVLVDNSGPGPVSAHLDDSDTVKIIITMSCDPHTAAQLEESVKQSLLENAQVGIMLDIKLLF